jgi:hypothetical protein
LVPKLFLISGVFTAPKNIGAKSKGIPNGFGIPNPEISYPNLRSGFGISKSRGISIPLGTTVVIPHRSFEIYRQLLDLVLLLSTKKGNVQYENPDFFYCPLAAARRRNTICCNGPTSALSSGGGTECNDRGSVISDGKAGTFKIVFSESHLRG